MQIVAMVHRTKNFSRSCCKPFLQVLPVAPRGEARKLFCSAGDYTVLRPYSSLRIEGRERS
jgi:hypothetical protein